MDHPQDPGGATNMGTTQATHDRWRRFQGLPTRPARDISARRRRPLTACLAPGPLGRPLRQTGPRLALALLTSRE